MTWSSWLLHFDGCAWLCKNGDRPEGGGRSLGPCVLPATSHKSRHCFKFKAENNKTSAASHLIQKKDWGLICGVSGYLSFLSSHPWGGSILLPHLVLPVGSGTTLLWGPLHPRLCYFLDFAENRTQRGLPHLLRGHRLSASPGVGELSVLFLQPLIVFCCPCSRQWVLCESQRRCVS